MDAAKRSRCRGRADECFWIPCQLFHTRFVSKNAAAGKRRTRIDRQNGDPMPKPSQHFTKRFYEGAFPGTGNTGDADADTIAGEWQQLVEQFLAVFLMFGTRTFQQSNRFAQVQTRTTPDSIRNSLD